MTLNQILVFFSKVTSPIIDALGADQLFLNFLLFYLPNHKTYLIYYYIMPIKTPICDFGQVAKNFELKSTNNEIISLDECKR